MESMELMRARHSVRKYTEQKIEPEKAEQMQTEIDAINRESGLFFALVTDNEAVFKANQPSYGSFSGCRNCLLLFGGKKDAEKVGYFGERLVLFAQSLGLNTCWCALTFEKKAVPVTAPDGMKLFIVVALGYGETQGVPHKTKPMAKLAALTDQTPEWFKQGMEAAMLAPTAVNQQRFRLEQAGDRGVRARALFGPCAKIDLGIVKYHFELGAGKEHFDWV
jgi:nitroreductase